MTQRCLTPLCPKLLRLVDNTLHLTLSSKKEKGHKGVCHFCVLSIFLGKDLVVWLELTIFAALTFKSRYL